MLQLQLELVAFQIRRQFRQHVEGVLKLSARFDESRSLTRLSAGLEPVVDRSVELAGLRIMVRDEFGRGRGDFNGLLGQHFGNLTMQFPPRVAKHAGIGLVLDEGVLERVTLLGWRAALKYQTRSKQAVDRRSYAAF